VQVRDYTLGPDLNQCCGGRVQLWIERLLRADLPVLQAAHSLLHEQAAISIVTHASGRRVTRQFALPDAAAIPALRLQSRTDGSLTLVEGWQRRLPGLWLFGAGHVGQAIVRLLADLPLFAVHWLDTRSGVLPDALPSHVTAVQDLDLVARSAQATPGSSFLVLTHDHALDYALCRAILARGDFAWLGLIGSASKRARFRSRLAREGFAPQLIDRLCCPIGIDGIRSKLPAAIAVGVVAQLLAQAGAAAVARTAFADDGVAHGCSGDCADCAATRQVAR
jgi:xanthine dehydrogenase accessory factor